MLSNTAADVKKFGQKHIDISRPRSAVADLNFVFGEADPSEGAAVAVSGTWFWVRHEEGGGAFYSFWNGDKWKQDLYEIRISIP